jgi:hypothetical protein
MSATTTKDTKNFRAGGATWRLTATWNTQPGIHG